jgi:hypothetical protein
MKQQYHALITQSSSPLRSEGSPKTYGSESDAHWRAVSQLPHRQGNTGANFRKFCAALRAVIVQEHYDPYRAFLLKLAAKHRLAYMSGTRETTMAGGLVSISADWLTLYERAAFYVDKIIKGAKPTDLPVEQPTRFQTVLNMRTAQALGLTISPLLLAQIDEVIE